MCDITNLFKATIKTVKIREKSYNPLQIDKSILPKTNRKTEFTQNAKNVVFLISKLKEFLLEHRKDYLNAAGFFGLEQSVMSDLERDKIDTEAEAFMKKCKEAIHHLKLQVENQKVLRQVREHKDAVLGIIDRYLIAICKIYSEQKAIRVKRSVDRKRMARLQMEPIQSIVKPVKEVPNDNKAVKNNSSETTRNKTNKANHKTEDKRAVPPCEDVHREVEEIKESSNLTADESMMLQIENDQIFNELSTMVDEIKQLEGKIVEISRLQTIFTEKILEQEKDIEKVADTVVMTTENIKEANEVIREAMKNNAGFRVWVLFFLLVCTLSLLFLDWYNA